MSDEPKTKDEVIKFSKIQKRLLDELTEKHAKEINIAINDIIEDLGLDERLKKSDVQVELLPQYAGLKITEPLDGENGNGKKEK